MLVFASAGLARAGTIDGVITAYVSGNEGTDVTVKTSDGHTHAFWFDNMKKPVFQGKQLPWCPEFPCTSWPSKLVIGKTHVRVTFVQKRVEGKAIESPTRIDLLH
jgi:hypothetical protein